MSPRSLLVVLLATACGTTTDAPSGDTDPGAGSLRPGDVLEATDFCPLTVATPPDRTPSWSADVAPLLGEACVGCHTASGIGPIALDDPSVAHDNAVAIANAVAWRRMPPFPPRDCGDCNHYKDARWLTDAQIGLLQAWSDAGAPVDDPAVVPTGARPPTLDDVAVTLQAEASFTPDASLADDYHCFLVDPGQDVDRYLTGFQVRPGDAREVHHAILYRLDSDAAATEAAALDVGGDGWTCFGGPGVAGRFVAGWAPGAGAIAFPEGTGIRLPAHRPMVLQVHYNLANGAFPDRTAVDLRLADSVAIKADIYPVYAKDELVVPPGEAAYDVVHEEAIPPGVTLTAWGVAAHAHTTATRWHVEVDQAGGTTCGMDIPHWDFHWQDLYFYETPLHAAGGDTVRLTCTYDTRGRTETLTWGEGTTDEMCIAYFFVSRD